MAIAFRDAKNATGSTSVTITKPTGTVSGDVLILHIITETNKVITATGWTQIDNVVSAGTVLRYASYYKVAGGSEPASYTINVASGTYTEGIIACYSGVDNTTPINAHTTAEASGSTSTPTIPSVTTTVANTMLSVGLSEWFGKDWSGFTPTGFTRDAGITTSAGLDVGSFHEAVAASGATGTTAVTWSSASAGNVHSITVVALAPAGGGSSVTGAAALSTDVNAVTAGKVAYVGASALSVNANITAQAAMLYAAISHLSVDGNLTASGVMLLVGLLALATDANLTASGSVQAGGTITGAASLVVDAVMAVSAKVAYAGAASLRVDGNLSSAAALALSAQVILQAQANMTATGARAVTGASALQTNAVQSTVGALTLAAQVALSANANATFLAALALVGASALQTAANMTASGTKQNTGWRPPTGAILLQTTIAAVLALQSQPTGIIILQDSPEGTVE